MSEIIPVGTMTRLKDGSLPTYTSVGTYPLVYLDTKDNVLCAACASNPDTEPPAVSGAVHWEGPPEECEECGAQIESAYGDPGDG